MKTKLGLSFYGTLVGIFLLSFFISGFLIFENPLGAKKYKEKRSSNALSTHEDRSIASIHEFQSNGAQKTIIDPKGQPPVNAPNKESGDVIIRRLTTIGGKYRLSGSDREFLENLRRNPSETFSLIESATSSLSVNETNIRRDLLFFASELEVPLEKRTHLLRQELMKALPESDNSDTKEALTHFPAQVFERLVNINPEIDSATLARKSIEAHRGKINVISPLLFSYHGINPKDAELIAAEIESKKK